MKQKIEEIVNLELIKQAVDRISEIVVPTPIKRSPYLSLKLGKQIYLKLENLNVAGAFKIRGATNALNKNREQGKKGVVAASSGNHAQGVAFICRHYKVPAIIFMPETAPYKKRSSTMQAGAKVILAGRTYNDASEAGREYHLKNGGLFIHPFADPDVIAGQGTIGLELLQQIPDLDAVIVPIGGGGLISGIACAIKALRPQVKIIGVQTMYYQAMQNKFAHLQAGIAKEGVTLADGIAVKHPSDLTYALVEKYVDDIVLIGENEITAGILHLMEHDQVLAEGAGAAATAALIAEKSSVIKALPAQAKIVSIVSGGNIDISLVSKVIARGLYMSGRLMRLKVKLQDQPGNLVKLLSIFSEEGVNILEVSHNRIFSAEEAYVVECSIDIETVSSEQQEKVKSHLTKSGYSYTLG